MTWRIVFSDNHADSDRVLPMNILFASDMQHMYCFASVNS